MPRSWRDAFRGLDAILACPGPSLAAAAETDLHVPGAFVVGLNTSWPSVRPDVWVGMDPAECYAADLLWQPFPKFMGTRFSEARFGGEPVKTRPGVHFISGRKDIPHGEYDWPWSAFHPDRLGDQPDFVWCLWSIWSALHVATWLGARRIWLVGCDLGGRISEPAKADYHDGRTLEDHLAARNAKALRGQLSLFPRLLSEAARGGFEIVNTSESSALVDMPGIATVPLAEALETIRRERGGAPADHVRLHAYVALFSAWSYRPDARDGVITGADRRTEWMLPWWWERVRRHEPDLAIAFADFGLSDAARSWCRRHGRLIDCRDTELAGWHNKPTAILRAGFARGLWLDTDCEVIGPLAPAFAALDEGTGFRTREDAHRPDLAGRTSSVGTIAVRYGEPLVGEWARAILSAPPGTYRGDQEALATVARWGDPRIGELPARPGPFEHLRLDGPEPAAGAAVFHHTGPAGKKAIREAAMVSLDRFGDSPADALIAEIRRRFGNGAVRMAEVGCLAGRTSARLLEALPGLTLSMVDRWAPPDPGSGYVASGDPAAKLTAGDFERSYASAARNTAFAGDRCELFRAESADAAATFPDGSLDVVYLDADHTAEGVARDLAAWAPKVRPGGILCGHDWEHPAFPRFGVKEAVLDHVWARVAAGERPVLRLGVGMTWFVTDAAAEPAAREMASV